MALGASRTIVINGNYPATLDTNGNTFSVAGAIDGSGNLAVAGSGTLVLTASNGYSGGTTITGGTLQVGNGGSGAAIGAGGVTLYNNGTLVFNHNDNVTFSGQITNNGNLTQTGPGVLTLLGNNNYSGTATISGGTLQVCNGAAIGGTSVVNNGSLLFNDANSTTVSSISGSGSLTQIGTGVVTLTGTNTYSGATTITSGGLQISGTSVLSQSSNIVFNGAGKGAGGVLQSNGTLNLTTGSLGGQVRWTHNSGGFAAQGGALTVTLDSGGTETWGVAPFNVSGGFIFGSPTADSAVNFTNSIILNSGDRDIYVNPGVGGDYALISGNLITASTDTTSQINKEGNGLLILTGSNSYPGGTSITAGTLQIGNGGNTGTLGSGVVSNSGVLALARSDNSLIVSNAITGTGSLTQIGAGIVTLTGSNTYTGPTIIAAGTLRLGTGGSLGATAITVASGGTLNAWSGTSAGGSLTLATSGTSPAGLDLTSSQIGIFNLTGQLYVPYDSTPAN